MKTDHSSNKGFPRKAKTKIPIINRTTVFIDGQNFYRTLHEIFPGKWPNLQRLMAYLRKGRLLHSVHYYDAIWPASPEFQSKREGQIRFQGALRHYGFKVWTKESKKVGEGGHTTVRGNIDVELAVDAMSLCSTGKIAELILFSADGDFSHMLNRIHFLYGVTTTVIGPDQYTSFELRNECNRFLSLEEIRDEFMEEGQPGTANIETKSQPTVL